MPSTHVRSVVPNPWDPAAPPGYLVGMYDLMFLTREILQPRSDTSYTCLNCCSLSVRSWNTILIWFADPLDPAARSWYLVVMYALMFWAREIMQHRSDTSYARPSWCFESVRSWSHLLIPSRHVLSEVPNPWEPTARPDTLYAYSIWCSLSVKSCSPVLIRSTI